jgi:hypothetical protein
MVKSGLDEQDFDQNDSRKQKLSEVYHQMARTGLGKVVETPDMDDLIQSVKG